LLSRTFDVKPGVTPPCDVELPPSAIVALVSAAGQHDMGFFANAEQPCWQGKGLRAVPEDREWIERGRYSLGVALLRVEPVSDAWIAQGLEFGVDGRSTLRDGNGAPWPLDRWSVYKGSDSKAFVQTAADGLRVRTHAVPESIAALYTPMQATVAGYYRFSLHTSPDAGSITFGAVSPDDPRRWVARDSGHVWDGSDYELVIWVHLKTGEAVQLAVANNNGQETVSSRFLLRAVSAVRVSEPAENP